MQCQPSTGYTLQVLSLFMLQPAPPKGKSQSRRQLFRRQKLLPYVPVGAPTIPIRAAGGSRRIDHRPCPPSHPLCRAQHCSFSYRSADSPAVLAQMRLPRHLTATFHLCTLSWCACHLSILELSTAEPSRAELSIWNSSDPTCCCCDKNLCNSLKDYQRAHC